VDAPVDNDPGRGDRNNDLRVPCELALDERASYWYVPGRGHVRTALLMPVVVPNFVVIGASKAGTSSLYAWLRQHPDIFVPRQKELNFFARGWLEKNSNGPGDSVTTKDLAPTWDAYLAHYRDAGARTAVGDVSPSYFAWPGSADEIKARLGDPKILLVLRNPIQKAFSQYTHLLRDGRETLSFWDGLQAEPDRARRGFEALWRYLGCARYSKATERFMRTFSRKRMKVLFFEDLARDPGATLRDILRFLDVDPDAPIDTSEVRNRSGAPRSKALASVLNSPGLREAARRSSAAVAPARSRPRGPPAAELARPT
jgi:hypothetical protein